MYVCEDCDFETSSFSQASRHEDKYDHVVFSDPEDDY